MYRYTLDFTHLDPNGVEDLDLSACLRLTVDWREHTIEGWDLGDELVRLDPDGVWRDVEPTPEILATLDDELSRRAGEILWRLADDAAWEAADFEVKARRELGS